MPRRLSLIPILLAALAFALLPLEGRPGEPDDGTVVLVAKRGLQDKIYGSTILFAKPVGSDRHVGFILNKPSQMTLGKLFPEHPASRKVPDPVFLGGPFGREVIFALVNRKESPGGRPSSRAWWWGRRASCAPSSSAGACTCSTRRPICC